MSHVGFFFFSCLKCIFSFIFSADDEQMVIAFSALYIGDFCVARWGLLLQVMVGLFLLKDWSRSQNVEDLN